MIMLGSQPDYEFRKLIKQLDALGGAETQTPYVLVQDTDSHYARAVAAGATIVRDIEDASYGGRGYSCRDLEVTSGVLGRIIRGISRSREWALYRPTES
jgi:uncharacterized glyoxalase superfamily protein PhnB